MLSTRRHSGGSGHTAHEIAAFYSAWHTHIAGVGVLALYLLLGCFPFPACPRAYLHTRSIKAGLPPGSARFLPSGFIPAVFARLGCQVGSLLFRVLLSKRATALYPGEVQQPFLSRLLSVAFAVT